MVRLCVLRMVAAATLLAGGGALARDLAADAPYPVETPQAAAATSHAKPHHEAKQTAVPLLRSAPAPATTGALPPEKPAATPVQAAAIPIPKAAPERPKEAAPTPKLASLPPVKSDARPGAKPATATERTNDIFAGIPAGERLQIQASLLWAGDYTGASGSEDPMLTAIKNFQKRIKAKVTGVLTAEERARLVAADKDHADAFGWTVVTDPATGVRLGLPAKFVTQSHEMAGGTRWSSKHGEVQVETFRIKNADLKLATVFEDMKRGAGGNRKIETSALRDDGFVISGMQGLKNFTTRAKMRDGEVRGVTVSYDQMMETIVAPVTVAMASAFTPFPERIAPFAALAKSVDYGTGIVVSARGHIVTAARLAEGCQSLVASGLGNAERVAEDKTLGLELLRIYGRRGLHAVALSGATQTGEAKLIGIPDPRAQNGAAALTEVKARLTGGGIELRQPAPMAGLAGAAAVDAQGHFAGIAEMRNIVVASNEPAIAPVRLVGTATIRDFLAAHNVTTAAASGDAKDAVVRIICVRK
jgi:hypothetical protein